MHTSRILIKYLNGDILDNIFLKKIKTTTYWINSDRLLTYKTRDMRYEMVIQIWNLY